jgi:hypothetical protein
MAVVAMAVAAEVFMVAAVGMAVALGTAAEVGTVVAAGTAAASALRTSTIGTSSSAAIIRTMTATIPITITRTAGLCGPIGDRAAFAVITTGTATGIAGTIGTGAIGDLCFRQG